MMGVERAQGSPRYKDPRPHCSPPSGSLRQKAAHILPSRPTEAPPTEPAKCSPEILLSIRTRLDSAQGQPLCLGMHASAQSLSVLWPHYKIVVQSTR